MSCDKRTACTRFLRRGPCACTGCAYSGVPHGSEEDSAGDSAEGYEDDYDNTGSRKFTVVMRRTTIEYARIEVAADDEGTAEENAQAVVDNGEADWEFDYDEVNHIETEDGWGG